MKKAIVLTFLLSYCLLGQGQDPNSLPLFQSANAASLGMYGTFEVSPFTGLADINIDVFKLKEGDIDVSASLSYLSGGVKPAFHPGWVGQNWSLNVGGIVTRKVNGGVDEVAASTFVDDTQVA